MELDFEGEIFHWRRPSPFHFVAVPDDPGAARIKADHPMAFADAFGAALAVAERATLWTGDPELLVAGAIWQWRDLRDTG